MSLNPPVLLSGLHDVSGFDCAIQSLNDWLKRRALANQISGATRSYVVCDAGDKQRVMGYYALASGALAAVDAPGAVRRNMPDPIPMVILGRLAADKVWQGRGLGLALLQDAVLRAAQAARILGVRGVLVHAISTDAKAFFERHGFQASPTQPMTLVLSIKAMSQ